MQHARSKRPKVSENEFDAGREAVQCSVVAREGEACGGRVERNDCQANTEIRSEAKSEHRNDKSQKVQHHTAFAGPREGDRVTTDAAECVEDDVTATPFCYLRRYRLGRYAIPTLLVQ